MRYVESTSVSSEKSRFEIERTLSRYGAKSFMYGWSDEDRSAVIMFEKAGKQIKFLLPLPNRADPEFTRTPNRNTLRTTQAAEQAYEQAVRQKWRALALVIKAKLEAVESGITEFDAEFLSYIMLPNGVTVYNHIKESLNVAYESGTMPHFLPWGRGD